LEKIHFKTLYSAATAKAARSFVFFDNSAITSEALAIGLVK